MNGCRFYPFGDFAAVDQMFPPPMGVNSSQRHCTTGRRGVRWTHLIPTSESPLCAVFSGSGTATDGESIWLGVFTDEPLDRSKCHPRRTVRKPGRTVRDHC